MQTDSIIAPKKGRNNFCPIHHTLDLLGGKWKLPIIAKLEADGTLRFKELERAIEGITPRMLTKELQELERQGIVTRVVFAQVPPRVEYTLTPQGASLRPLINEICRWGRAHKAITDPGAVLCG